MPAGADEHGKYFGGFPGPAKVKFSCAKEPKPQHTFPGPAGSLTPGGLLRGPSVASEPWRPSRPSNAQNRPKNAHNRPYGRFNNRPKYCADQLGEGWSIINSQDSVLFIDIESLIVRVVMWCCGSCRGGVAWAEEVRRRLIEFPAEEVRRRPIPTATVQFRRTAQVATPNSSTTQLACRVRLSIRTTDEP